MLRNLAQISSRDYDLVIVGGGIFGICAAWDAVLRGLSVALLERADFGHAASANCFKMIHGGIRYIQHADIVRLRHSAAERSAFLRIAPHLARPLPIFVPTYGHGMKGKEILSIGMKAYDLLTADRNRGIADPGRQIPATRTLSRSDALDLYPFLDASNFTGGAVFHDGQMHSPDLYPFLDASNFTGGAVFHDGQMHSPARLALSVLLSAVAHGAEAANHAEVTDLLRSGDTVRGVRVRDTQDGSEYEVAGRVVLNATGSCAGSCRVRSRWRSRAKPGIRTRS